MNPRLRHSAVSQVNSKKKGKLRCEKFKKVIFLRSFDKELLACSISVDIFTRLLL